MKKISALVIIILTSGLLFGQDGFGDIFDLDEIKESEESVVLNGDVGVEYKSYLDDS